MSSMNEQSISVRNGKKNIPNQKVKGEGFF